MFVSFLMKDNNNNNSNNNSDLTYVHFSFFLLLLLFSKWPDLTKFRNFGKFLKAVVYFSRDYLVLFGNFLMLRCNTYVLVRSTRFEPWSSELRETTLTTE